MKKNKLPAFQFYPGDWMKDPALRVCGPAARGLWIDMLCLMFETVPRGYLVHGSGAAVTAEHLSRMTGCSEDAVRAALAELETFGVFSRNGDGVIYSRRMLRDERRRQLCGAAGRRGGGNPDFKGRYKGLSKEVAKNASKRIAKASSSLSSSTAVKKIITGVITKKDRLLQIAIPAELEGGTVAAAWRLWIDHLIEAKPGVSRAQLEAQLAALLRMGPGRAAATLEHSVRIGAVNLYEPDPPGAATPGAAAGAGGWEAGHAL